METASKAAFLNAELSYKGAAHPTHAELYTLSLKYMTTPQAAALYQAQHIYDHSNLKVAVFNPHNKLLEKLPTIYGFNNGGMPGLMHAVLIAEDGTPLGGHCCSSEAYMPADLGILEGTRPDRHEEFQKHYPDGYKMEFVSYKDADNHPGLNVAFKRHDEKYFKESDQDS